MVTTDKLDAHLDKILWPDGNEPKSWEKYEHRNKASDDMRRAAIEMARSEEPLLEPLEFTRAESWAKKINWGPYWVKFITGKGACVNAPSAEEAKAIGERLRNVVALEAKGLPYPASPELNPIDGSGCPTFCYSPSTCAGRGSCPKNPACSE